MPAVGRRSSALLPGCLLAATVSSTAWAGGAVKVSSDVVGMQIFMDGADTGLTTPATVGNLSAGRHEVRVRGDCRVGAKLVDVVDGATVDASLSTAEGRGQLTVDVVPAEASVRIDGAAKSGEDLGPGLRFVQDDELSPLDQTGPGQVEPDAVTLLLEIEVGATNHLGQRRFPALPWTDDRHGRRGLQVRSNQVTGVSSKHFLQFAF